MPIWISLEFSIALYNEQISNAIISVKQDLLILTLISK